MNFREQIAEHLQVIEQLNSSVDELTKISKAICGALSQGKKVIWLGNGGSAADSQHLAAELVGRYRRDRRALSSIALTTDTSILTAIANDFGYDRVFERQVEACCNAGDVVVGISTSGNSSSVVRALVAARKLGAIAVAFTGKLGGELVGVADVVLRISSTDTARIQEAHILAGHLICDYVERNACE